MAGAIPIGIFLGLITVFIGAYFQRKQWLNNLREEIRVRETKGATEVLKFISEVIDRRISAQRRFLWRASRKIEKDELLRYRDAVEQYSSSINQARAKLFFYFEFSIVRELEEGILNPIVFNGARIEKLLSTRATDNKTEIESELSLLSAQSFGFITKLYVMISQEEIGQLKLINDWREPGNQFTSTGWLLKRLFDVSRVAALNKKDAA